jgi:glycosyltransferase involved in cell wall biosynthesis
VDPVLRADPGARVVATVHSNHTEPGSPQVPHRYARLALDRLDELVAVTPTREQLGDLRQLYGRDAPILLAPHALARRSPRRRPRAWARDLVRRPPTVVVVLRFVPVKRVDHLLRAFALVQATMPEARLQVWGDGPDADALAALARELRLKRVRLAGRTTDATAVLRRARAGASTSAREGFGLATAETLAAGTPVVSYDYRYGPRDLVVSGVNGYLVPDGDVGALARRLLDLAAAPGPCAADGGGGHSRALAVLGASAPSRMAAGDRPYADAGVVSGAGGYDRLAPGGSADSSADPGQELFG